MVAVMLSYPLSLEALHCRRVGDFPAPALSGGRRIVAAAALLSSRVGEAGEPSLARLNEHADESRPGPVELGDRLVV